MLTSAGVLSNYRIADNSADHLQANGPKTAGHLALVSKLPVRSRGDDQEMIGQEVHAYVYLDSLWSLKLHSLVQLGPFLFSLGARLWRHQSIHLPQISRSLRDEIFPFHSF